MRSGLSFSTEVTDVGDLLSCSPSEVLPLRREGIRDASAKETATVDPVVFIVEKKKRYQNTVNV